MDVSTAQAIDRADEAFSKMAEKALEEIVSNHNFPKAVNKMLNEIGRQFGVVKHRYPAPILPYVKFNYLTFACNQFFVACWRRGQDWVDTFYPSFEDALITGFVALHPEVADNSIVYEAPSRTLEKYREFTEYFCEQLLLRHTTRINLEGVSEYVYARQRLTLRDLETEFGPIEEVKARLLDIVRENQKLGVKPCFYPDEILLGEAMSWIFYDPLEFLEKVQVAQDISIDDIVAGVFIAPTDLVDSLEITSEVYYPEGWEGLVRRGYRTSFPSACTGVLTVDGKLDFSFGRGYCTLNKVTSADLHPTNSLLELQALSLIVELTCPEYQAVDGHSAERAIESPCDGGGIGRLLVPRIRSLLEQRTHKTPMLNGRVIRVHDVIWHIRRLPHGWHHTAMAQEFAKLHGIELAPNETFVREHQRGSEKLGQGPSIHQLVRR